ncbi:MAG: radical SAM family heme chaperone HemW [Spirochaetia bacterium]|nr:radical SAM family heme chaperone HemW [Spirochaetia bacterium]
MTAGVYIHIPFCRAKCRYCGFYSVPAAWSAYTQGYAAALKKEIMERENIPRGTDVDSVYIGGGTPSMFPPEELKAILSAAAETFHILPGAEISLEMNPSDARLEKLSALADAGFNRLTLGVQTMDPVLHATIGRAHELCTQKHLDAFFSFKGITHCVDLITGIPGQKIEDFERELKTVASYCPEHISAYLLSIEEGTPLSFDMKYDEPLESLQRAVFLDTERILEEMGYTHYEISNYALPGFESSHNSKYWTFQPYISFGSGAHSFYGGRRYINNIPLEEYIANPLSALDEDERKVSSAMAEFIMTALRMTRGFSMRDFAKEFGSMPHRTLERINSEIKSGLIILSETERVCLSKEGLLYAERVIYNLVQDLL